MDVGHLTRDADVVGMEIAEVLFAVFGVVKDLSQRFVAVGIDVAIGISAVRVDILTNISLSLAIFFSWVFKSSYKLQIIVKFTWIFLIKCCIRIVI